MSATNSQIRPWWFNLAGEVLCGFLSIGGLYFVLWLADGIVIPGMTYLGFMVGLLIWRTT